MLHKYRTKEPIKAEQFDGSEEMMKRYHITYNAFSDTFTFRLDNERLPLKRGWWIVYHGEFKVMGYKMQDWRTMDDNKFRKTYERYE